jgi:hypothetical protein
LREAAAFCDTAALDRKDILLATAAWSYPAKLLAHVA